MNSRILGAAAAVAGAMASFTASAATFEHGGLTWTYTANGTAASLTAVSDQTTAFNAANIPWTFTADGTAYTVTKVEANVFKNWTALTGTLAIPDTVTSVASFEKCAMTGLSIGAGVTSIPNYCFKNCTKIPSVVVPANVTSVGSQAFFGCTALKAAWIKGPATVASGTQANTTVNDNKPFVNCKTALKVLLFGRNTKCSGSGAGMLGDTEKNVTVFAPDNGQWETLTPGGTDTTVLLYGPGRELDFALDETARTLTATPTTTATLVKVLAAAPLFRDCFGLETRISVTNALDLAAGTITAENMANATFNTLMFKVNTQAELDGLLAAVPAAVPLAIDPSAATAALTLPADREVWVRLAGTGQYRPHVNGLVLSLR